MIRPRAIIALTCCIAALTACRQFPEIDVSEARFDKSTPYPEFVPLDVLLEEPEPEIDAELETELTQRGSTLNQTPEAPTTEEQQDPLLDRLDALRAKRAEQAGSDPIISDELRERMTGGITAPTIPE